MSSTSSDVTTQVAPKPGWRRFILLWVAAVVAVGCLSTLIRIEVLNRQAGYVLPRHEYFNGDPESGLTKWRYRITNEVFWRKMEEIPEDRPLTAQEQADYLEHRTKGQANNDLHDAVRTWGLLQYPLTVLLGVLAGVGMARHQGRLRRWHGLLLLLAGGCLWRATYLGYFTSLGW